MRPWLLENMNRRSKPGDFPQVSFPIFESQSVPERRFRRFEKTIGYVFRDSDLLTLALTHKSSVGPDDKKGLMSNERLEFLGDAGAQLPDYRTSVQRCIRHDRKASCLK